MSSEPDPEPDEHRPIIHAGDDSAGRRPAQHRGKAGVSRNASPVSLAPFAPLKPAAPARPRAA